MNSDGHLEDSTENADSNPANAAVNAGSSEASDKAKLDSEEQMAQWEEALKNDDWGHQPC